MSLMILKEGKIQMTLGLVCLIIPMSPALHVVVQISGLTLRISDLFAAGVTLSHGK